MRSAAESPLVAVPLAFLSLLPGCIGAEEGPPAPVLETAWDEDRDRLEIVSVTPQDASWENVAVYSDQAGLRFALDGTAASGSPAVGLGPADATPVASSPSVIDGSDWIAFCAGEGHAQSDVHFTLLFEPTGETVEEWTASFVVPCEGPPPSPP